MFEPKGEKPYWKMVYDYIKDKEIGDVIVFDELSKVIGEDIRKNRSAVYKARKRMLEDSNKFLDVERGAGYKVVDGMDIMRHADGRHKKAKRQIVSADYETANIDVAVLSPEEKKKLQDFMYHNANIQQAFSNRIDRIEKANQVTQIAGAFTQGEVEELRKMIGKK